MARLELQPAAHDGARRRRPEPGRDDEGDGPRLAADRVGERLARLPQREVERGALVGPAAVRVRHPQHAGEALERTRARERKDCAGRLLAVVMLRVPGHVLSDALLITPLEVHHRRHAGEAARDRLLQTLELVTVDLERESGEALP